MPLTRTERKLLTDVRKVAELARRDHWNIEAYDPESRATYLRLMMNQIVRSEILMKYVLIDEFLSVIICHTYFRKPKQGFSFKSLWRTKRFQAFNYFVLEQMSLRNKLALVNHARKVPSKIRKHIDRLNGLRNAIAHSFFPENKRDYRPHGKVIYGGFDIFSAEGVTYFLEDRQRGHYYAERRQCVGSASVAH